MSKIKKSDISQKWGNRIKSAKSIYDRARKNNKSLSGFYRSDIYKDLKSRKTRALKRYDNRKAINERQREYRKEKKEVEKAESEQGVKKLKTVSVFEAFSGTGRIFEQAIIKANEGKEFIGHVKIINEGKEKNKYFSDFSNFKIYVNKFLKKMYEKGKDGEDEYEAFIWKISRFYKVEETKLFVKYLIEKE